MKVLAITGSDRKKHTWQTTERFLLHLKQNGGVDYEMISLSDYNLQICKGCKLCLDRGEELCSLNDDRDNLIQKLDEADGIVFASPNYSFQVSGRMKVFLDRLGFMFHRPRFFGKTYTSIVAQGVYGGKDIVKYLDFVGNAMGCNVVKGVTVTNLEPVSNKAMEKNSRLIEDLGKRFLRQLEAARFPQPSLFKLMVFRMSRSSIKNMLDESFRDYTYYTKKGWFDTDYYYPVKLNPAQKLMGNIFDRMATRSALRSKQSLQSEKKVAVK